MNVASHRAILGLGLVRSQVAWLAAQREALLRGNDDEDVHIVPGLGWRLRSAGFTHSYRPGYGYGEMWTPSALTLSERYAAEARGAAPGRVAYLLGRIGHLLVDAAVPARSRGVWHFLGDPFEDWVEAHASELAGFGVAEIPAAASVREVFDKLAGLSCAHAADTTRTPWGRLAFAFGRGVRPEIAEIEKQARLLVPAAVAHVAALFRIFERPS